MAIDLWRLRLLDTFARLGTVRAAAAHLLLSPSTVTHHLGRLEAETGLPLFERAGRSLALTPTGALLAARAREVQDLTDAIEAELAEIAHGPAGHLRIGGFSSAIESLLIPAATALADAHSRLTVELLEIEPRQASTALLQGDCELVVAVDEGHHGLLSASITTAPLSRDPLMAVLPVTHPLAGSRSIDLGALADSHWALDVSGSYLGELVPRRCRQAGFEPRVAGRFTSYQALLSHVAAGLSVGILPRLAVRGALGIAASSVAGLDDRRIVVATRKGAAGTAAVRAARRALQDAAGDLG